MEQNEGRELVEYTLIAIVVAAGMFFLLNSFQGQLNALWDAVARMVLG